jgi:Glucose / Sorbosone dehydrogenase
MSRITRALLVLAALTLALPASAAAAPQLVPVGTFSAPIHAAGPPGDPSRVFVVERAGTVRVITNGVVQATPFLTIPDVAIDGERGLLSIAFAPDYPSSGLFYVYLVADDPAGEIQVREYRRSGNPDVADPNGRVVFRAAHPDASNHNGGQLAFGPDRKLWLATGDGGGSNDQFGNARDLGSPLGKLLRIEPQQGNAGSFTIPDGNPFGAIWAYGLRNPFRFSFDRITGDLWIGDVGQSQREEVDWVRNTEGLGRGTDYEWSCREGSLDGPNDCPLGNPHTPPVFDYSTASPRAVTGGVVVRDPGLPTLDGRYIYADFYDGAVHTLTLARPTTDRDTGLDAPNLAAFGEDACGHIYVVSLSGPVYRLQDGAIGPCVEGFHAIGPTPPPAGPSRPALPDHTSPRVSVRVARKGRVGRRATPRIVVTASESCRVTISARLAGTRLKRVRTPLRAGRRTVVRLRPKAKAIKKIHRALRRHKRVTMTVSVVAVDAAGNTGRVKRRLKVRRG